MDALSEFVPRNLELVLSVDQGLAESAQGDSASPAVREDLVLTRIDVSFAERRTEPLRLLLARLRAEVEG